MEQAPKILTLQEQYKAEMLESISTKIAPFFDTANIPDGESKTVTLTIYTSIPTKEYTLTFSGKTENELRKNFAEALVGTQLQDMKLNNGTFLSQLDIEWSDTANNWGELKDYNT